MVIDEAKPGDTSGNSGTGGGEGPQRPGSSAAGMATNTVSYSIQFLVFLFVTDQRE